MEEKQEVLRLLSKSIRMIFEETGIKFSNLQEIRLRVGKPLLIIYENEEFGLEENGKLTKEISRAYVVSKREVQETMEFIGKYSLYAYENEIKQGFLTVAGGHRVGLAGKIVLEEGKISGMKYITHLNIRFAHEVIGCGKELLPFVKNGTSIYHTLLVAPPRCGKTTLLRDLVRQLSDGEENANGGMTVGVIDERSEICGCYMGIPGNDVGIRTDILDCCPKAEGMMMMIRSMSPQVIAIDEVGSLADLSAIESVVSCGCSLLATVHGSSMKDLLEKPVLKKMVEEQIFKRYIFLENKKEIGKIREVLNEKGERLW